MARQVPIEAVFETLGRIAYPGYQADIATLGLVERVDPLPDGGFALTLRQVSERDDLMRSVAEQVHQALTQDLGVPKVEMRVRRVEPELGEKTGRVRLPGTKYIVAVASGKGGVGKSTVAVNLACALSQIGYGVGLLDADIYGPSIPTMFATVDDRPKSAGGQNFYPIEKYGVKMISIGFFLGENAPVIWRGPLVMGAVRQFLRDTLWGSQDFLVVDLPPGTGDAQITLAQQVSVDGTIIVTTPQDVAVLDAMRAVRMFRQVHCPILGVVENMSYFECPDCGERDDLFGHGGGDQMAQEEGLEVLVKFPIYPELRESSDAGMPLVIKNPDHPASLAYLELARRVAAAMPPENSN